MDTGHFQAQASKWWTRVEDPGGSCEARGRDRVTGKPGGVGRPSRINY